MRQVADKVGRMELGTRPDLCFKRLEMMTKPNRARVKDLIAADKMMKKIKESDAYYTVPKDLGSVRNWTLKLSTDASLDNLDG